MTNILAPTVVLRVVSTIQQVNYSSPDKYYDQYLLSYKVDSELSNGEC